MQRVLRSQSDYQSTLLRNQLTSLVLFESVSTTAAKAKQLIPFAERFFNRVKLADMNARRFAHQTLLDPNAVQKVFEEILPRYKSADSNYVREYRLMPRRGDNAPQILVTFINQLATKPEVETVPAKTTKKKAGK